MSASSSPGLLSETALANARAEVWRGGELKLKHSGRKDRDWLAPRKSERATSVVLDVVFSQPVALQYHLREEVYGALYEGIRVVVQSDEIRDISSLEAVFQLALIKIPRVTWHIVCSQSS